MTTRRAVPSDALAVATVHVRSWQEAYRGLMPADYLDNLSVEERAARYTFDRDGRLEPETIVAVDGGQIIGFATVGPARDPDVSGSGELMAIYVDPEHWGTGAGRELMAAAREALAAKGFEQAVLWVLQGNDRATRFYDIDGWTADGIDREDEVWGLTVAETRYRTAILATGGASLPVDNQRMDA